METFVYRVLLLPLEPEGWRVDPGAGRAPVQHQPAVPYHRHVDVLVDPPHALPVPRAHLAHRRRAARAQPTQPHTQLHAQTLHTQSTITPRPSAAAARN